MTDGGDIGKEIEIINAGLYLPHSRTQRSVTCKLYAKMILLFYSLFLIEELASISLYLFPTFLKAQV